MGAQIVVPLRNPNPPPPPPDLIADDEIAVEYWNLQWSQGVAILWTEGDMPAVTRAAHMYGACARCGASGEAMTRLNVQISKLEASLFLNPSARRNHNIVIEVEEQPRSGRGSRREANESRLKSVG